LIRTESGGQAGRNPEQGALVAQPQDGPDAENDWVQDEQHRVKPLLAGLAKARVNELVLRDEQARDDRRGDIVGQAAGLRRQAQREAVAGEHTQRIERVAYPFPTWQAASAVEIQLVHEHAEGLQTERNAKPSHGGATF
jgi:hypothetical protein